MILWLLLYTQLAISQDQAIEEYCFSSEAKSRELHARLKFILLPVDKVESHKNCLTINTSGHRRELIQNYVRRLDPSVHIGFSSAEVKRDPCRIKVEKIMGLQDKGTAAHADTSIHPSITAHQTNQKRSHISTIQTIKDFELAVNQDSIKGECRAINSDRYEVKLEVIKEAVPLLPPLPPGSIVVVPDAQIPKEPQETMHLATTVQLNRGEKLELGSVIKKLKNDATRVDIQAGANVDNSHGTQQEKVFLSLD